MNKYIIPCTEEQTKKALELGAPIEKDVYTPVIRYEGIGYFVDKQQRFAYHIPTAEEMVGWLEEQGILIDIDTEWNKSVLVYVWNCENKSLINNVFHGSRREATPKAIDVALEYLANNK